MSLTDIDIVQAISSGVLDPAVVLRSIEKFEAEKSLLNFLRLAWPFIDPAPLEINWHHEAIIEHLEAVSAGQIRRLLINVPPRSGKTSLVSVVWPAWVWAQGEVTPLKGPQVKFLCVCYAASLSLEIATTARRLITSEWYQGWWGDRVIPDMEEFNRQKFATKAGGTRTAASIEGGTIGRGGDVKIIDDPHSVADAESDTERRNAIRLYDEALSSRVTDPRHSAEVVIMQRLHEDDLSGHILDMNADWDHLMIPMQYDPKRYVETSLGWTDPRGDLSSDEIKVYEEEVLENPKAPHPHEGVLMWGDRFDEEWAEREMTRMGSVAWSGQMQQMPVGRGTEIIKPEWWQLWENEEFPEYGTCIAALDTAYKEHEEADYNALTVWAAFAHPETLRPKLMMRAAWQKRANLAELARQVARTCQEHKVERLLIEDSARGIDVEQEIYRLIGRRHFQIELIRARGDKLSRLNACVPVFEAGVVYAPDREWADMVIRQVASFPRAKHDDLCFVAGTLITTQRGDIAIERLVRSDKILTPIGWCAIKAAYATEWAEVVERRGLIGTGNHPVFILNTGFVALDSITMASQLVRLRLCDLIRLILPKSWNSWASSTGEWAAKDGITYLNRPRTQDGVPLRAYMWPSGSITLARWCLEVTKCIIGITTRSILILRIWSAYRWLSIAAILRTSIGRSRRRIWRQFANWRRNGIEALKGGLGIDNMLLKVSLCLGDNQSPSREPSYASGAVAKRNGATRSENTAQCVAQENGLGGGEGNGSLPIPTMQPVYNLTVEGACGYFANGILVHNCDTVSMGVRWLRENGVAVKADEHEEELRERRSYRKPIGAIYDI